MKYSASGDITAANWASATTYRQSWTPSKNGTTETHVITGLGAGIAYWFAVEAYDEIPNFGGVSNSPRAITTNAIGLAVLIVAAVVGVGVPVTIVAVAVVRALRSFIGKRTEKYVRSKAGA